MDDREMDAVGVEGRAAADRLVGVPARARDDRRRSGDLGALGGHRRLRAADEVRAEATDPADRAILDPVRGAGPVGLADPPAARRAELRATVRERVLVGRQPPRAPAAAPAPRPVLHDAGTAPVQADELEHARREHALGRLRPQITLLHEAGPERRAREGGGESESDGGSELPHGSDPRREWQTAPSAARAEGASLIESLRP